MRLFRTELSRLTARRFTRIMAGIVLLVLAAVAVGVTVSSHPHNAAARAAALAQVRRAEQEQLAQQRDCEAQQKDPNARPVPGKEFFPPGFDCAQLGQLPPEDQMIDGYLPHQFSFRDETSDTLVLVGLVLALLAFAVGASFVGAEWSSGGVTTLLLWRPRRLRLLAAKLLALLFGVLLASVAVSAAWVAGMWAIARTRGDASRITHGLLASLALTDARALALILGAAVLGFGIASIGRHTATAMGVAIGYAVVLEIGARIVLPLTHVRRPERFYLSGYAAAWLEKSRHYSGPQICRPRGAYTFACEQGKGWMIHMNQGAVVLGVLVVAVLVWAFASIRYRDVT